jgi:hypothetical protein
LSFLLCDGEPLEPNVLSGRSGVSAGPSPAETPPSTALGASNGLRDAAVVDGRLRSAPDGCMLCSAGPLAHVVVLAAEKLSPGAIAPAAKQLRRSRRADAAPPGRKRSSAARASRLIWIIASSPKHSRGPSCPVDKSDHDGGRTAELLGGGPLCVPGDADARCVPDWKIYVELAAAKAISPVGVRGTPPTLAAQTPRDPIRPKVR